MLVDLIEHFIALELLIDDFFIAGDSYKRLIYFRHYFILSVAKNPEILTNSLVLL